MHTVPVEFLAHTVPVEFLIHTVPVEFLMHTVPVEFLTQTVPVEKSRLDQKGALPTIFIYSKMLHVLISVP